MTSDHPQSETAPPKFPGFRSRASILLFVLTAVIGLSVDLWSKSYSWRAHTDGGPPYRDTDTGHLRVESDTTRAIPGWLHFKVTVNEGAVFGIGQGNQMLFAIVSIGAIALLTYLFATSNSKFYHFVLGMLLAGVLGNLYDRMFFGYVRDMIYALPGWHWPGTWKVPGLPYPPPPDREVFPWIFNIADTLLCVGVGLMVVYVFFAAEPETGDATKKEPVAQPAQ